MAAVDPLGYDELPYPCAPYPQTHPEHLATLASLLGLEFPDPANARVLEIGCGDGANLIPLAYSLPGAELLGIDLSEKQVEAGQATIRGLGLKQVRLQVRDLRDVSGADGPFDYIIAHGVYSWTPPDVRDALVALFRRCLTAQGIGLISYNALPGWSNRLALRHWLLESIGATRGGSALVAEARRRLRKLWEILSNDTSPRGQALCRELSHLLQWSDGYLRHDLLEDHNEPVYFRQFAGHLAAHGLRFLAEADFPTMVGQGLPPQTATEVQRLSRGVIEREQLYDSLTDRQFRQSLVVHAERQPAQSIDPRVVERMWVGGPLKADEPAGASSSSTTFRAPGGFAIEVQDARVAACLRQLSEIWPAWISFDELSRRGVEESGLGEAASTGFRGQLINILLAGFAERAVELHVAPPPFTVNVSTSPCVSPLAQWQSKSSLMVTNLRHDLVRLDTGMLSLLSILNSDVDRSALPAQSVDVEATLLRLARAALILA